MNQSKNIVTVSGGVPVLENSLGCKLVPFSGDSRWGLGSLYFKDKQIGETIPWFLTEQSSGKKYRASGYEIVENSPLCGTIRFTGKDGKLDFGVTITLYADSYAYSLDFDFDPLHPVYHPLYINIPFAGGAADFVKYPYETNINKVERWTMQPDYGRTPFMFGNLISNDFNCFVGAGYVLSSDYTKGRLEYDPIEYPNSAIKLYTPFEGMARPVDLQCVTRLELVRSEYSDVYTRTHHLNVVISTAGSQFDCIRSYIARSGYNDGVEFRRSIKQSCDALYDLFKRAKGYVPGKGYHQLIRFDTGDFDTTVPHGWYSKYIVTGPQLVLSEQLYKLWAQDNSEDWARQRAFEMADFALSMQEDCGAFTNWDTDIEDISIMHPNDVEGTEFNRCIYSVSDMGLGIIHWLALYNEVLKTEGVDRVDWKDGILKATGFLVTMVGTDGELGRNYDLSGHYDKLTSAVTETLLAFDCVAKQFAVPEIENARDRLEKWVYDNYLRQNNWCNGSVDGGAWQGADWPPPHNNDLMGVFNFANYCAGKYRVTQQHTYLQMAKDAVAYIWTSVAPADMAGFNFPTRTLVKEQDFYSIYGILIRGNDSIECLPYLAKVTDDPFFMKFYRLIIQTQIAYQEFDMPYSGFHIGLECDESGRNPANRIAEGNNGYITRFIPQFIKSVTSETAYRYVGGSGWGLGADYNLAFDPDMGEGNPYVLCASTMVRDVVWDAKSGEISVYLYDTQKAEGILEVKWPDAWDIDALYVTVGDEEIPARTLYDSKNAIVRIPYKHQQPSKLVRVRGCRL